nr:L-ornithine N(5)-monooxygenase-like [Quercus suber]POF16574.1 l-ornithine n(5)-monooxygenase [Quercus suber]
MSPHAIQPPDEVIYSSSVSEVSAHPDMISDATKTKWRSLLRQSDSDEVHDLVCVGFGPASLAIGVALHDSIDASDKTLRTHTPKVRFLERQSSFHWHAGMLLPGATMQITFLKDLATMRNPRSEFTFINYLHQRGRLVQFSNLGTFLPLRIEYEDYMKWCAGWFDEVVDYNHTVESVKVGHTDPSTGAIEYFVITSRSGETGLSTSIKTKNVVVATGGRPNFPECLPNDHPRVIHSSQYATSIDQIFPNGRQPRTVAVIGAGQSAAEVFNNIPDRFPSAKVKLLIRGASLRPSDDSPFVNEIFDPQRVDDVYAQNPTIRAKALALDKATNYAVVRLELLEHIYSTLYSYQIRYPSKQDWPQQIINHCNVRGVTETTLDGEPSLRLELEDSSAIYHPNHPSNHTIIDADLIVVASGYQRNAHEDILHNVRHLMPGGDDSSKTWTVRRDYGVDLQPGLVNRDVGIWLQGCNEATHGLSDSLLSILATRGGEMVQSIFGTKEKQMVVRTS